MIEPSLDAAALVDQLAALVALPLQPDHRPGVIDNFARIVSIAQLVTEFPLPDDIEIAPNFEP
ncbi:MAG: DUF4089 domain-containing protein [Tildeniella nuda ZEHNDER 1965/U140]|jgi:hypothetical protein|nr:DUF4089 domain-containing protein [Tildeniella nuda ZEHNDER 1965/U140]